MASNSTMTVVTEPDADGDTILLVGPADQSTPMRVSSKILTLASPVFKAMLSTRFAEGQSPASSTQPRTILLPEDNARIMLAVFQKLHFHTVSIEDFDTPSTIAELALVCDEYDLAKALDSWTELMLQKQQRQSLSYKEWAQLLRCSRIFKNHSSFWFISNKLLLEFRNLKTAVSEKDDHSCLGDMPPHVFGTKDFNFRKV